MSDDAIYYKEMYRVADIDAERWRLAALLKDRTRRDIRARARAGEACESIARDFGVPVEFVLSLRAEQLFEEVV